MSPCCEKKTMLVVNMSILIGNMPTHILKLKKEVTALCRWISGGSSSVVEHLLPKQRVVGSNPISRSRPPSGALQSENNRFTLIINPLHTVRYYTL